MHARGSCHVFLHDVGPNGTKTRRVSPGLLNCPSNNPSNANLGSGGEWWDLYAMMSPTLRLLRFLGLAPNPMLMMVALALDQVVLVVVEVLPGVSGPYPLLLVLGVSRSVVHNVFAAQISPAPNFCLCSLAFERF
jgi:hypothetical protein